MVGPLPRSPLAPVSFPEMPAVPGVRVAAGACGVDRQDRRDVALIELADASAVAGVFTRSLTAGAPVNWCRSALAATGGSGRAVLVNSGNANAFTGRRGDDAVRREARALAERLGCTPEAVLVASTGVIGQQLPVDRITDGLHHLVDGLTPAGWEAAADAIRTTDTFAKGSWATAEIDGTRVTLAGIAKGSGMIAPDMGTMLAFLATDANLPASTLDSLLREANATSFNCITVDSDCSTSDSVLLAATGKADTPAAVDPSDPRLADFRRALGEVMRDLAQQVVRDGEGAEKFVTVRVSGAESDAAARRIGLAIANSPLVKTAVAGGDPNWGRIVMAVGKAGEWADRDRLAIWIGGHQTARDGEGVPDLDEAPLAAHMAGREIDLAVDVGVGAGSATVWTCDLTDRYIAINADYRS
ncbi:glutamate N-acetyltransferase [Limimonas halophila]|uniref:Arginine biosynthesis bifunctional protein ArgJ n=1 Tax=Limimonas halophila TaxID=1082479 RepID=A0A1G7PXA6_9PROT|nr:bifunctional glutamate N-acetyltransferase/amino-acid acetyltransferase ArgJ [Limimonas halophila]SDF90875.1 glutamate N-acetyltransferase [Limimonas halophila]